MRLDKPPRRVRKLNSIYEKEGGVRAVILAEMDHGTPVVDIAAMLGAALEESISAETVYLWARTWRKEKAREGVSIPA